MCSKKLSRYVICTFPGLWIYNNTHYLFIYFTIKSWLKLYLIIHRDKKQKCFLHLTLLPNCMFAVEFCFPLKTTLSPNVVLLICFMKWNVVVSLDDSRVSEAKQTFNKVTENVRIFNFSHQSSPLRVFPVCREVSSWACCSWLSSCSRRVWVISQQSLCLCWDSMCIFTCSLLLHWWR